MNKRYYVDSSGKWHKIIDSVTNSICGQMAHKSQAEEFVAALNTELSSNNQYIVLYSERNSSYGIFDQWTEDWVEDVSGGTFREMKSLAVQMNEQSSVLTHMDEGNLIKTGELYAISNGEIVAVICNENFGCNLYSRDQFLREIDFGGTLPHIGEWVLHNPHN